MRFLFVSIMFGLAPNAFSAEAVLSMGAATDSVGAIFDANCVSCHGAQKHKGGLRLDDFSELKKGGDSGLALVPGDSTQGEILRRLALPRDDEEAMPPKEKPSLPDDLVVKIKQWIATGAPRETFFPGQQKNTGSEVRKSVGRGMELADLLARVALIKEEADRGGIALLARSQTPGDGLDLSTASFPSRCNDGALASVKSVDQLLIDASLARTAITDTGLITVSEWKHLRALDLSFTGITSAGLPRLTTLRELERLNLINTNVDAAGVAALRAELPQLKKIYFDSNPSAPSATP